MLSPSPNNILQNIIFISSRVVILQTLRAGYITETQCDNKQEIKTFRTGALLGAVRNILDELEPYMQFLVDCEEGNYPIGPQQIKHIIDMMKDLTGFYTWACEEVKLRNQRLALIELESKWKKEKESD